MAGRICLRKNLTIVFTGDSITDADHTIKVFGPFGNGYVHFVANTLLAKYPELNLSIRNTGISGSTTRDLMRRWQEDCIGLKPDILSVLIGVNDLYRRYGSEEQQKDAVFPDEYEENYRWLLENVKEKCDPRLILMEPFLFCSDRDNEACKALSAYIEIVHKLARRFDAVLVPLQSGIDEQIKTVPAEKWSADMVHPALWAHRWICRKWLQAAEL